MDRPKPLRNLEPFGDQTMLRYALTFFVIALIASLFGFGVIANSFMEVARILFFIFVVLAVVSLLGGGYQRRGPS
jgi:uncharacterized membrane protein YtjA (UPF0391 family)